MEYLLPYLCTVTVPHIMVGLERMLDYRGVELARFHCITRATLNCSLCAYVVLGWGDLWLSQELNYQHVLYLRM